MKRNINKYKITRAGDEKLKNIVQYIENVLHARSVTTSPAGIDEFASKPEEIKFQIVQADGVITFHGQYKNLSAQEVWLSFTQIGQQEYKVELASSHNVDVLGGSAIDMLAGGSYDAICNGEVG